MSESNTYQYSAADIRRYHNGGMTAAEMYALEKMALEDPFLADAVEGYAGITGEAAATDLGILAGLLNDRAAGAETAKVVAMHNPEQRKTGFAWWKLGVAAAVAALLVFTGIQVMNRQDKQTVAGNLEKQAPPPPPATATGVPAETATTPNPALGDSLPAAPVAAGRLTIPKGKAVFIKPESIDSYYNEKLNENLELPKSITGNNGEFNASPPIPLKLKADNDNGLLLRDSVRAPGYMNMHDRESAKVKRSAAPDDVKASAELPRRVASEPVSSNQEYKWQEQSNNANMPRSRDNRGLINIKGAENGVSNNNIAISPQRKETDKRSLEDYDRAGSGIFNNSQAPRYFFNYRTTDVAGNIIPFTNITVPADNMVTYSRADGSFGLASLDSVVKVDVKAMGYQPQSFTLRNNTAWSNLPLTEDKIAAKDLVVVGDQKNYALKKRSGMLTGKLDEAEPADGWENYDTYLANNIDAKDKPRGEVELSFTLNKNGEPVDVKIDKSLSGTADQEAVRLLTQGPKWKGHKKKTRGKVIVTF